MGEVSCLATEHLGPYCCHDNMAGYHVENRKRGGEGMGKIEMSKKYIKNECMSVFI